MARTFIRQETQIRNSDLYDDTLGSGVGIETGQTHIEGDLNAIRSMLVVTHGQPNWYDAPTRSLEALNTDLADIEARKVLCRVQNLTDITVGAGNNFVVLSQAGAETPTEVIANVATTNGAVAAIAALSANSLNEIAGPNALSPKNLVHIIDSTTRGPIESGGRDIFGLLQAETGATDGGAWDDAANQAQLSFVRINAAGNDLEAVPFADIAGSTINYSYVFRTDLENIGEECFLGSGVFTDNAGSVDVTLDNAIDNQSGPATQVQNIDVQITDTFEWAFQDSTGSVDILSISANVAGDVVQVTGLTDLNGDLDVSGLSTFDSDGAPITIDAGVIQTTGGTDDLTIKAGQELFLDDTNQTGSTWAQTDGIKLSETTAEWDLFETNFGEVSLLNAINQAGASALNRVKACAQVTSNEAADTDIGGVAGGTNLDAQLQDLSAGNFVSDYDIYLNGSLERNGANAAANMDVYPGTSLATGQLKFEKKVKNGDQICVICWA